MGEAAEEFEIQGEEPNEEDAEEGRRAVGVPSPHSGVQPGTGGA